MVRPALGEPDRHGGKGAMFESLRYRAISCYRTVVRFVFEQLGEELLLGGLSAGQCIKPAACRRELLESRLCFFFDVI